MSYEDVSKEPGRRSEAWKHFLLDKSTEKCKCKVANCEKILMAKNGSTRGLLQHLRVFHKSNSNGNSSSSESQESEDNAAIPSKKKSINNYMLQKTKEEKEEDERKYK